jgi:hypothetical protein
MCVDEFRAKYNVGASLIAELEKKIDRGICAFTGDGVSDVKRGSTFCSYRLELAIAEE